VREDLISTVKKVLKDTNSKIPLARLLAIIEVESSGSGFGKDGRLLLQFEPNVFSRRSGVPLDKLNKWTWDENKVDVQSKEWLAFEDASKLNPIIAMESTSWGLPQIMGFNFKLAGYQDVKSMVESFKVSEYNQIKGLLNFINSNRALYNAIITGDYEKTSEIYNGRHHRELAAKNGWKPYPDKLKEAEERYKAYK
jgi:hypothetical protein